MSKFWRDLAERTLGTIFATGAAMLSTAVVLGDIDWKYVGSVTAVAALMTVMKGGAAKFRGSSDNASFLDTDPTSFKG